MYLRKEYYKLLQKIFHFHPWHITPASQRPYASFLIRKINYLLDNNNIEKELIVEIGCGCGDIIANINLPSCKKIGYDVSKEVVTASKFIHPLTQIREGTFFSVLGMDINVLIVVGVLHTTEQNKVERYFTEICKNNKIKTIIIDAVQSPPYRFSHNYKEIFANLGYYCSYRSRGFKAVDNSRRHLEFYTKIN